MNKKTSLFFLIGLLLIVLFLSSPSWFGVCVPSKYGDYCAAPYGYIADAFLPLVSAFLLVNVLMLALRDSVLRTLSKFSLWYGVVSIAVIGFFIYHDTYSGGFSPYSLLSNPIPVSWLLSILYVIISLLFVVINLLRRKN